MSRFALSGRRHRHARLLESLEPRTLLSTSPTGYVDVISRTGISGWAFDATDGPLPVKIDVTVDGATTSLDAATRRDDLLALLGSRYHGFSYSLPTLSPGAHDVQVYARNADGVRTLLRQASLTNPAPVSYVDVMNDTTIAGWAVDTDDPSAAVQIRLDLDSVAGTPQNADYTRGDLVPLYGSANHGFLLTGDYAGHVVDLYAQDQPSGQWVLVASNNHRPTGYVDHLSTSVVSGWVYDQDLGAGAVSVRVDIDGNAGTPAPANIARPDLTNLVGSPNHGFSVAVGTLAPGNHDVKVYALDGDSTSAAPKLIGQGTLTNTAPTGYLDQVTGTTVAGWAYDPDAPSTSIQVSVYVDDLAFPVLTANGYRPDLIPIAGSANHGFAVDLSALPPTSHEIVVTLHDAADTSNETVLYDGFVNNHEPIGYVDSATSTTLTGWSFDADVGADPVDVDVYVDNTYAGTSTANIARPDLAAVVGSPNHGFSINLPAMSFGAHQVQVFAAEGQGTVSTLIGTATVTNHAPTGWLDALTPTAVSGWAFDQDAPAAAVEVRIYVDGVQAKAAAANLTRPDLAGVLGSANHGFSIALDPMTSGDHEVTVFLVDPNNSRLIALATRTLQV